MSQIAIKGATTGTGVFTLESPATNTDRTLVLPDEAGTVLTTAGVPASAMPAGSVIQVVSANVTSTQSLTATTYTNVSSLDLSITPTSASSKILVNYSLVYALTDNSYCGATIYRNGTNLMPTGSGTGIDAMFWLHDWSSAYGSYRPRTTSYSYLDTPNTTSAVNYQLYVRPQVNGGFYFYLNRSIYIGDNNQLRQALSTVTLMEIAG